MKPLVRLFACLSLALGSAWAFGADVAPQVVKSVAPDYPAELRAAGIEGRVIVQLRVDTNGAPQDITVYKADRPQLGPLAVAAVRQWRFRPAMKDGRPETAVIQMPFIFDLHSGGFHQSMPWANALKLAAREHKLVMVDFFTTWCEPCKRLDRDTWTNPAVIALLRAKTIAFEVDAEKNAAMARAVGVAAYPTIDFIRPDGKLADRLVGYRDPQTFIRECTDILAGVTSVERAKTEVTAAGTDPGKLANARFRLAQELANRGENAEALDQFLWCLDAGMKQAPAMESVRLSFLLTDIADLGAHYPPALAALRQRRDAASRLVESGDPRAVTDFASINQHLGEAAQTLEVYDREPADSPVRMALGQSLFDTFIQDKRYRDAAAAQPAAAFATQFESMRAVAAKVQGLRTYLITSSCNEIEALAGAGQLDNARALLSHLLKFDRSPETVTAVRAQLARAGQTELIRSAEGR